MIIDIIILEIILIKSTNQNLERSLVYLIKMSYLNLERSHVYLIKITNLILNQENNLLISNLKIQKKTHQKLMKDQNLKKLQREIEIYSDQC